MSWSDEGNPSVSIQATGSDRSRFSVVGEGSLTSIENQTNIYGGHQDPDIHVDLVDEREPIDVVIGQPRHVRVEITNLGSKSRELSLRVIGVPPSVGKVEPPLVPVAAGDHATATVVLLCTPTEPQAGKRRLWVRATDKKSSVTKDSNEKAINVPANTQLETYLVELPESMADSQQMIIGIRNIGNTDVRASLTYSNEEQVDHYASSEYVVRSYEVNWGTPVHLPPGQSKDTVVELDLPGRRLRDRRCVVPLLAKADRDGATFPNTFPYLQSGLLSELFPVINAIQAWLRQQMGRLYKWIIGPTPISRGLLLRVIVLALTFDLLINVIARPTQGLGFGSTTPVTASSPGGPLDAPNFPATYIKDLPCSPGSKMAFITSSKRQDTAETISYFSSYHIWLVNIYGGEGAPKLKGKVYISPHTDKCPTAGGYDDKVPERFYIWYAPADKKDVDDDCKSLRRFAKIPCYLQLMK